MRREEKRREEKRREEKRREEKRREEKRRQRKQDVLHVKLSFHNCDQCRRKTSFWKFHFSKLRA
jgi:hypothetical protein